jgi:hypothetical protein
VQPTTSWPPGSTDKRIVAHLCAVAIALLILSAARGVIGAGYAFSPRIIGIATLYALPYTVAAVAVAECVFGMYSSATRCSWFDAGAAAALATALAVVYSSTTGGTPRPVITIPLEIALIATGLRIADAAAPGGRSPSASAGDQAMPASRP